MGIDIGTQYVEFDGKDNVNNVNFIIYISPLVVNYNGFFINGASNQTFKNLTISPLSELPSPPVLNRTAGWFFGYLFGRFTYTSGSQFVADNLINNCEINANDTGAGIFGQNCLSAEGISITIQNCINNGNITNTLGNS